MRQSFQKEERLKSKIVFQELISDGQSTKSHPFVLIWLKVESPQKYPIKVAFSVAKKRFPLAVDRNLLKRRIREAYRLNKNNWYDELDDNYALLIVYTSKAKMDSKSIEKKLIKVFERFVESVN
jgi:ribonuclease P protein component